MNKKYLYGASVQGIQGFIFQTNALKEIAGGSELVEQICTTEFADAINKTIDQLEHDENAIVTAAGNIKYIFEEKDELLCNQLVRTFPKRIMEFAPGITLSQAVVKIEGNVTQNDLDLLEEQLKIQRNRPFNPTSYGVMGILKSRRTGLPVVEKEKEDYIDRGQQLKIIGSKFKRTGKVFFGDAFDQDKMPFNLKDITSSKSKNYSWLAIVHADGNNMGLIIQKMAEELAKDITGKDYILSFRKFSQLIDKATKESAAEAYAQCIFDSDNEVKGKFPFRPVIIGGDDLTVICRADLAIPFTLYFLEKFEQKSKDYLGELKINALKDGITACAGIAFIKESYPFHYGYHLAEALCSHAKKEAKIKNPNAELTPSCIMFHKVLDSFVEDYRDIIERELKANDIRLDYGPYYLKNAPSVTDLIKNTGKLTTEEGKPIKSSFREWLTLLHNNNEVAKQKLNRMISVGNPKVFKEIGIIKAEDAIKLNNKTPVYDWLTMVSINEGGN